MWVDPMFTDQLYIPDDIVAAFGAEARQQVEQSRPAPPRLSQEPAATAPAPRRSRRSRRSRPSRLGNATRVQRLVLATLVWLVLIGLGVAAAWGTLLSFEEPATQWTALSFGGGAAWVLGTALALSYKFPPRIT